MQTSAHMQMHVTTLRNVKSCSTEKKKAKRVACICVIAKCYMHNPFVYLLSVTVLSGQSSEIL